MILYLWELVELVMEFIPEVVRIKYIFIIYLIYQNTTPIIIIISEFIFKAVNSFISNSVLKYFKNLLPSHSTLLKPILIHL
jgi:hypothetical protein